MNALRPIDINKIFQEPLDLLIAILGGIQAPLLCPDALRLQLKNFPFMSTLDSSVRDQAHIPKEYWFDLANIPERRRAVVINGCQAIAGLAFEKLRAHPKYDQYRASVEVRLLGHLRNAGSHGNKFWFKNSSGKFVDPGMIEWSHKKIDGSLHGKQDVFPDLFSLGDFFHLFDDISKLLRQ